MSIVKCDAISCAHNSDCVCDSRHIKICCAPGDCSYVYCSSYRPDMKAKVSLLMQEMGWMSIEPGENTDVSCSAAGCVHNRSGVCKADNIKITAPEHRGKACMCVSFKE